MARRRRRRAAVAEQHGECRHHTEAARWKAVRLAAGASGMTLNAHGSDGGPRNRPLVGNGVCRSGMRAASDPEAQIVLAGGRRRGGYFGDGPGRDGAGMGERRGRSFVRIFFGGNHATDGSTGSMPD